MKIKTIGVMFIGFCLMLTNAWAFELITADDITQKIIIKKHLIKTSDNALFLFDASSSMAKPYKDTGMSRYDVAKKLLIERNAYFPDLGYNFGFYLYTPWKEIYPMQKYDRDKYAKALASLPEKPTGPTLTTTGLKKVESILKPLKGRTTVFLFTDGSDTNKGGGMKKPAAIAEELAKKYDVCFFIINTNDDFYSAEIFAKAKEFNFCSRVIGFDAFLEYPAYNSEALYTVVASKEITTVTDQKIVGVKPQNILFDFDNAEISQGTEIKLNILGTFLKTNKSAFVVMAGHTDSIGDESYNLALSKRRVEQVASYLEKKLNIDTARILSFWYGELNPLADNTTTEGQILNRRVEILVGEK